MDDVMRPDGHTFLPVTPGHPPGVTWKCGSCDMEEVDPDLDGIVDIWATPCPGADGRPFDERLLPAHIEVDKMARAGTN